MLRIATFNLLDFFEAQREEERAIVAKKRAYVADRLGGADADVVAVQEVGSERMLRELMTGELGAAGYVNAVFGPTDRRGIGCAIVSRLPIVASQVHTADEIAFPRFVDIDPEPFKGRIPLRRGLVQATIDAGALGHVDVVTIHFKSKLVAPMKTATGDIIVDVSTVGYAESVLRSLITRSAEALHLRRLVDTLLAERADRKLCVLGDFNDTIESLPLRMVCGLGALPEATLTPCTDAVELDRRFTVFHAGEREQIDHILASHALAAHLVNADIDNHGLRDHGPHDPEATLAHDSDHALVFAEFA